MKLDRPSATFPTRIRLSSLKYPSLVHVLNMPHPFSMMTKRLKKTRRSNTVVQMPLTTAMSLYPKLMHIKSSWFQNPKPTAPKNMKRIWFIPTFIPMMRAVYHLLQRPRTP